jgi:hypothetical protein
MLKKSFILVHFLTHVLKVFFHLKAAPFHGSFFPLLEFNSDKEVKN